MVGGLGGGLVGGLGGGLVGGLGGGLECWLVGGLGGGLECWVVGHLGRWQFGGLDVEVDGGRQCDAVLGSLGGVV